MDIWQLEVFLAVIEHSSVTRASERVGLSPGAVSLQMHNLANELRTELFVKTGKRLSPTPAALHLAEKARALVRQVREIENEFQNDPAADTRPVRLATGATTLIHRLSKPLRALRKQYPKTEFLVTVSATEEMVAGLLERRFDLALISLPFPTENLTILPLFEEELLILRPSAKEVRGWHVGNITPAELAKASFILYPRRSNMRTMMHSFFDEIGVSPQVSMEADDTEVIKRLVESGLGYSILPEFALRSQPKLFQTFRVPGHQMIRKQVLAMVRSHYPRALVADVARFLQSAIRDTHKQERKPQLPA